jgi:iron complex outermembrane receptor protein
MRYSNTPDTKGSYIEGERLVNTPLHTANGSVILYIQQLCYKGLKIGTSVFFTRQALRGWNNMIGQTQQYSRLISVDGYTTVDISRRL